MERRMSNWWLALFWIPVLALVLGLMAGCATVEPAGPQPAAAPPKADLQRLVAQELDANARFSTFGAAEDADARSVAAAFRPVVADVTARDCRTAHAGHVDCTLEIVLRFPAIDGRQSHTTWERRLRHVQGAWQMVSVSR